MPIIGKVSVIEMTRYIIMSFAFRDLYDIEYVII